VPKNVADFVTLSLIDQARPELKKHHLCRPSSDGGHIFKFLEELLDILVFAEYWGLRQYLSPGGTCPAPQIF